MTGLLWTGIGDRVWAGTLGSRQPFDGTVYLDRNGHHV